jgi:hypothetical protein
MTKRQGLSALVPALVLALASSTAYAQQWQSQPTLKFSYGDCQKVGLSWTPPYPAFPDGVITGYRIKVYHGADADGPEWVKTVDVGNQTTFDFAQTPGTATGMGQDPKTGMYKGAKGTGHAPGGCTTYQFRVAALSGQSEAAAPAGKQWAQDGTPYSSAMTSSCVCRVDVVTADQVGPGKIDPNLLGLVVNPGGMNPVVKQIDPRNCAAGVDVSWPGVPNPNDYPKFFVPVRLFGKGIATNTSPAGVPLLPVAEKASGLVAGLYPNPYHWVIKPIPDGMPQIYWVLPQNSAGDIGGQQQGSTFVCSSTGKWSLKLASSGKYVSADMSKGGVAIADRAAVGAWEQFVLTPNSDGTVSLLAMANLSFLTIKDMQYTMVASWYDAPRDLERFRRVNLSDGTVTLTHQPTGQMLSVDPVTSILKLAPASGGLQNVRFTLAQVQ